MAYDPKKKRPNQKSLDSVVDEIFGEEKSEAKPAMAKAASKVTPITKKTAAKKTAAAAKKTPSVKKDVVSKAEMKVAPESLSETDNVTQLRAEPEETPLIMKPQVWVATGIAALIVLMLARKRRRR